MAHLHTPIIGLVGGVGCGKSAVARWLRDHLQARIVDADIIGHDVLSRDDVKNRLREAFGKDLLVDDAVDRVALAARVFGETPESVAARLQLERIVHPVILESVAAEFAEARNDPAVPLIVYDAAVQLESGWDSGASAIVYVDVPFEERLRRVAANRGWSADELRRREASQWPLDRKRAAADIVIDNSDTVDAAGRQLETELRQRGFLDESTITTTADAITH